MTRNPDARKGQGRFQNLKLKASISKDRFLIPGLGALSFFQFALPEDNRNLNLSPLPAGRRRCLLTVCVSQPSPLTPHSAISQEKSLPKVTKPFQPHIPLLHCELLLTLVDTPRHCWLCPQRNGFPFLPFDLGFSSVGEITTAHPVLVHQIPPVLYHRHECNSAYVWILYSTMLEADTLTFPGSKVATTTKHNHHQKGSQNLWKFILLPKGLAYITIICILKGEGHPLTINNTQRKQEVCGEYRVFCTREVHQSVSFQ